MSWYFLFVRAVPPVVNWGIMAVFLSLACAAAGAAEGDGSSKAAVDESQVESESVSASDDGEWDWGVRPRFGFDWSHLTGPAVRGGLMIGVLDHSSTRRGVSVQGLYGSRAAGMTLCWTHFSETNLPTAWDLGLAWYQGLRDSGDLVKGDDYLGLHARVMALSINLSAGYLHHRQANDQVLQIGVGWGL